MKKPDKRDDLPALELEGEAEIAPGVRRQTVTDGGLHEAFRLIFSASRLDPGELFRAICGARHGAETWPRATSFGEVAGREMAAIGTALMAMGWPDPARRVIATREPRAWRYWDEPGLPDFAAGESLHTPAAGFIIQQSAPFTETRLLAELWEEWRSALIEPDPDRGLILAVGVGEARERLAMHRRAAEDARAGRKVRRGGRNAGAVRAAETEGRRERILAAMKEALASQAEKGLERPNVAEAARTSARRLKLDAATVRSLWYRHGGK